MASEAWLCHDKLLQSQNVSLELMLGANFELDIKKSFTMRLEWILLFRLVFSDQNLMSLNEFVYTM